MATEIFYFYYFEVVFHWRSSSFLAFFIWFGPLSLSLKFEKDQINGCWDIQFLIFWRLLPLAVVFYWRSSSFQAFFILVWSPELKFQIWGRTDQWLLRYSTFNILRSSSILPLVVVFLASFFLFWFGPLSLSLKFKENPISSYRDIANPRQGLDLALYSH